MDSDALQQQRFIKLRQLKQEIDVATKDLEQFEKSKEKIGEELKELVAYKTKQTKQYQKGLVTKQKLERGIENIQKNLSNLNAQSKDILKQLDDKILAKTIVFNKFKDSKKDFVKSLEVREKTVKQQLNDLLEDNKKLKKEKKEFTDELIVFYKQKTQLRKQRAQIQDKISRNETERQARVIEVKLSNIKQIEQEKEQELKKQQKITNELKNRNQVLKLKTEAQDKREAPFRRFEKELKTREAKLLDDRNALNRAIVEKRGNK